MNPIRTLALCTAALLAAVLGAVLGADREGVHANTATCEILAVHFRALLLIVCMFISYRFPFALQSTQRCWRWPRAPPPRPPPSMPFSPPAPYKSSSR